MAAPSPIAPNSDFATAFRDELRYVEDHRTWAAGGKAAPVQAGNVPTGGDHAAPGDLTGLALSGGGMRSAAFSLGALQALDVHRLIHRFDYLSTVSGGGYMGAALTSTLQDMKGRFVFGGKDVFKDTKAVGYLRNYSSYLLPRDKTIFRNVLDGAAVIGRGLITNAVIVGGFILTCAALTAWLFPNALFMDDSFVLRLISVVTGLGDGRLNLPSWLAQLPRPFGATTICLLFLSVICIVWAVATSNSRKRGTDVGGPMLVAARTCLGITLLIAFLELQPVILDWIITNDITNRWASLLNRYVIVPLGGASAIVAFFSGQIATYLKSTEGGGAASAWTSRLLSRALILLAALILPLTLYGLYLGCTLRLMDPNTYPTCALAAGAAAFALIFWLSPNSVSLHRIYRDRLGRAFLFTETAQTPPQSVLARCMNWMRKKGVGTAAQLPGPAAGTQIAPRDVVALGELASHFTPFHIINTTLNLQGSIHANMRGRDSDVFVFTPRSFGSPLMRYHPVSADAGALRSAIRRDQEQGAAVDLGAAIAISGAAVSSAMGKQKLFRVLSPTLALLNIRLGYWLSNPLKPKGFIGSKLRKLGRPFYLLNEIKSDLREDRDRIYLTDGGHSENLGIYELLRRGCRLIVAIDAEADAATECGSLIWLQRIARIDFGIRIDIDTGPIAAAQVKINEAVAQGKPIPVARGPHIAIGQIDYPTSPDPGFLIYVKASMTGDEPDYVLNYKKNNPSFPHESTGDQLFSEEQFESYRALGFHVVDNYLSGNDAKVSGTASKPTISTDLNKLYYWAPP